MTSERDPRQLSHADEASLLAQGFPIDQPESTGETIRLDKEKETRQRVAGFMYGERQYAEVSVDSKRQYHVETRTLEEKEKVKQSRDFGKYKTVKFVQIDTGSVTPTIAADDESTGLNITLSIAGRALSQEEDEHPIPPFAAAHLIPSFAARRQYDGRDDHYATGGALFMKRQDGQSHTGFLLENPEDAEEATVLLFTPRPPIATSVPEAANVQAKLATLEPDAAEDFYNQIANALMVAAQKGDALWRVDDEVIEEYNEGRAKGSYLHLAMFRAQAIANHLRGQTDWLDEWLPQRDMKFFNERVLKKGQKTIDLEKAIDHIKVKSERAKRVEPPAPAPRAPEVPIDQRPDRGMGIETEEGRLTWNFAHKYATNVNGFNFERGTNASTRRVMLQYMELIDQRIQVIAESFGEAQGAKPDPEALQKYQDHIRLLTEVSQRTAFAEAQLSFDEAQGTPWLDAKGLFKENQYNRSGSAEYYPINMKTVIAHWISKIEQRQAEVLSTQRQTIFDAATQTPTTTDNNPSI